MTENEKVAEVLEKALAKMNDEGKHWLQGTYRDGHGSYCSAGAIEATTTSIRLRAEALSALAHGTRQKQSFNSERRVTRWNDTRGRTWSQIREHFEKTIARLRAS